MPAKIATAKTKNYVAAGFGLIALGLGLNVIVLAHLFPSNLWLQSFLVRGVIYTLNFLLVFYGILFCFYKRAPFFVIVLLWILGAEGVLRLNGYVPWNPRKEIDILVEPPKAVYGYDPFLGYVNNPGHFKITFPTGYSFEVTHQENGFRKTRSGLLPQPTQGQIWIFGCSSTYGWSLNDSEAFAWLVQEKLPDYEVINFAGAGYGMLQTYLQYREALKSMEAPKVAILVYAPYLEWRHPILRSWRKSNVHFNRAGQLGYPAEWMDEQGQNHRFKNNREYKAVPFMQNSALLNLLDQLYNRFQELWVGGRISKIAERTLEEFARESKQHDVKMILAGLVDDQRVRDMFERAGSLGIYSTDVSLDWSDPRTNNLPHDKHPSAYANRKMAEKLLDAIQKVLPESAPRTQ